MYRNVRQLNYLFNDNIKNNFTDFLEEELASDHISTVPQPHFRCGYINNILIIETVVDPYFIDKLPLFFVKNYCLKAVLFSILPLNDIIT